MRSGRIWQAKNEWQRGPLLLQNFTLIGSGMWVYALKTSKIWNFIKIIAPKWRIPCTILTKFTAFIRVLRLRNFAKFGCFSSINDKTTGINKCVNVGLMCCYDRVLQVSVCWSACWSLVTQLSLNSNWTRRPWRKVSYCHTLSPTALNWYRILRYRYEREICLSYRYLSSYI